MKDDSRLNSEEQEVERLVQAGYPAAARPDPAAASQLLAQLRAEQRHFYPVAPESADFPLPVLAGMAGVLLALAAWFLWQAWSGQPWQDVYGLVVMALGLNLIWIPFACWTIVQRRKNV